MCLKVDIRFVLVFSVYFTSVKTQKCGGDLAWGEEITVPRDSFGYYKKNLDCTFQTKLRHVAPNVLLLRWFSFDIAGRMESCSDYLEIFVSCSYTSLGRFCGSQHPSDVVSPDHCMRLEFHSDNKDDSGRGFKARMIVTATLRNSLTPLHNYRHLVTLNASTGSGIFSSPGYPGNYPASFPSQTVVFETYHERTTMRLYFMEFSIRGSNDGNCQTSSDDVLTIEGEGTICYHHACVKCNEVLNVFKANDDRSSREQQTLCGVRKPFAITLRDYSVIKIKFATNNDSRVSRGYVAGYLVYKPGLNARNKVAGTAWSFKVYVSVVALALAVIYELMLFQ